MPDRKVYSKVKHLSHIAWLVWGVAAVFYGFQFMLRVSPGVLAHDLMRDFKIDGYSLGILTACYYYAYAALQIPAGILMDGLKPRKTMTIAAIICSIGCLIFANSEYIYMAGFGRLLIGAGSAFAFLSCLKLGTLWFPQDRLPLVVGMTLVLGTFGASFANTPLAYAADIMGWREVIWSTAILGFVIAVLGWLIIRDYPDAIMKAEHAKLQKQGSWYSSLVIVASNRQSWLIALYGFLMYVPLSGFADLWGAPFLMSKYGITNDVAGYSITAFYVGIGIGSPLFSFVRNYLGSYIKSVQLAAIASASLFVVLLYAPGLNFTISCGVLFLAGLFLGGQFLAFSMTCIVNPSHAGGTAGGFHNMICMLSGVIAQPLIGYVLSLVWNGEMRAGVPDYSNYDYQLSLGIIPVMLIIAAIVPRFIREANYKFGSGELVEDLKELSHANA